MTGEYDPEVCEATAAVNAELPQRGWSADLQVEQNRIRDRLRKERDEQEAQEKNKWEIVCYGGCDHTSRLRVPGGWLYRTMYHPEFESASSSISVAFVPEARQ